jgi:hypothetical protein
MPATRFLHRVTVRAGALALSGALAVAPHVPGPAATPAADRAAPLRLKAVPTTQVGRVEGTRAYIAVSFDGHRVRVYVCDGTLKRRATIAQWFSARWDGRTPLRMVRDGIAVRLDPVAADGRISGELIAFSGPHSFTVAPASGPAGLYDGRTGRTRDTWIAPPDVPCERLRFDEPDARLHAGGGVISAGAVSRRSPRRGAARGRRARQVGRRARARGRTRPPPRRCARAVAADRRARHGGGDSPRAARRGVP